MTPFRPAHRNLAQRIAILLEGKPTPWQCHHVNEALDDLEESRFAQGEDLMSRAERPDLYDMGWKGKAPTVKQLAERLAKLRARVE